MQMVGKSRIRLCVAARRRLKFVLFLIHSHARELDDPQLAREHFSVESTNQRFDRTNQVRVCRRAGKPEDSYSRVLRRFELERIGEAEVEGDKCAPFSSAMLDEVGIRRGTKILFRDRRDIMTRGAQKLRAISTEVFIQLQFHTLP